MGAADDCKRHQESAAVGEGHLNITVHSFRPPKNHKNRPKRSHNYNILIDTIVLCNLDNAPIADLRIGYQNVTCAR